MEDEIRRVCQTQPPPSDCLRNWIFVPDTHVHKVLHLCHQSHLFCHPGINKTLAVVRAQFWWKNLTKNMKEYVSPCCQCNQANTSRHPLAGLLCPCLSPHDHGLRSRWILLMYCPNHQVILSSLPKWTVFQRWFI